MPPASPHVIPDPPDPPDVAPSPSYPPRPRSAAILLRGESISLARRAAATAKKRREEARAELERRGVREGVESALSTIVGASASTRANVSQNKAKRTRRVKWTAKEVQALKDGVAKYGEGRWAVILREYANEFNAVRISVDLKDKWRNLFKAQKLHVLPQTHPSSHQAHVQSTDPVPVEEPPRPQSTSAQQVQAAQQAIVTKAEQRLVEQPSDHSAEHHHVHVDHPVQVASVEVHTEDHQVHDQQSHVLSEPHVQVEHAQVRHETQQLHVNRHAPTKSENVVQAQFRNSVREQSQQFGHAAETHQHEELHSYQQTTERHQRPSGHGQESVYALQQEKAQAHVEHHAQVRNEHHVVGTGQVINEVQVANTEVAHGEHVTHAEQVTHAEHVSHADHSEDATHAEQVAHVEHGAHAERIAHEDQVSNADQVAHAHHMGHSQHVSAPPVQSEQQAINENHTAHNEEQVHQRQMPSDAHTEPMTHGNHIVHHDENEGHRADSTEHTESTHAQYTGHISNAMRAASHHQLAQEQINQRQYRQQQESAHVRNTQINQGALERQQLEQEQMESHPVPQQHLHSHQHHQRTGEEPIMSHRDVPQNTLHHHTVGQGHGAHTQDEQKQGQQHHVEQQQLEQHELHQEQSGGQQFQQQTTSHEQLQVTGLQSHNLDDSQAHRGQEASAVQQPHTHHQQMDHQSLETQPTADGSHANAGFEHHQVASQQLSHEDIMAEHQLDNQQHVKAHQVARVGNAQAKQGLYQGPANVENYNEQSVNYHNLAQHQLSEQQLTREGQHQLQQHQHFESHAVEGGQEERANIQVDVEQTHVNQSQTPRREQGTGSDMRLEPEGDQSHQQDYNHQSHRELQIESRQPLGHDEHITSDPNPTDQRNEIIDNGHYSQTQAGSHIQASQQFTTTVPAEDVHHVSEHVHTHGEADVSGEQVAHQQQDVAVGTATNHYDSLGNHVAFGKQGTDELVSGENTGNGRQIEDIGHGTHEVHAGHGVDVASGVGGDNLVHEPNTYNAGHAYVQKEVLEGHDASVSELRNEPADTTQPEGYNQNAIAEETRQVEKGTDYQERTTSNSAVEHGAPAQGDQVVETHSYTPPKQDTGIIQGSAYEQGHNTIYTGVATTAATEDQIHVEGKQLVEQEFSETGKHVTSTSEGLAGVGRHDREGMQGGDKAAPASQTMYDKNRASYGFQSPQLLGQEQATGAGSNIAQSGHQYQQQTGGVVISYRNSDYGVASTAHTESRENYAASESGKLEGIANGQQLESGQGETVFATQGELDRNVVSHAVEKEPSALVESAENVIPVESHENDGHTHQYETGQTLHSTGHAVEGEHEDGHASKDVFEYDSGHVVETLGSVGNVDHGIQQSGHTAAFGEVDSGVGEIQNETSAGFHSLQQAQAVQSSIAVTAGKVMAGGSLIQSASNEEEEKVLEAESMGATATEKVKQGGLVKPNGAGSFAADRGLSEANQSIGFKRGRSNSGLEEEIDMKRLATEGKVNVSVEGGNVLDTTAQHLDFEYGKQ